jgi:hypothetical protein
MAKAAVETQSQTFRVARKLQMIIGSDLGGPGHVRARLDAMCEKMKAAGGALPDYVVEWYKADDARRAEAGTPVAPEQQAPAPSEPDSDE